MVPVCEDSLKLISDIVPPVVIWAPLTLVAPVNIAPTVSAPLPAEVLVPTAPSTAIWVTVEKNTLPVTVVLLGPVISSVISEPEASVPVTVNVLADIFPVEVKLIVEPTLVPA